MLKKLLTGCLTIALATAMAVPAMADAKVEGRVRSYYTQKTVTKKAFEASKAYGGSVTEMAADARLGASLTGEAGSFTGTGYVLYDSSVSEAGKATSGNHAVTSEYLREAWISLSNEMFTVKFGRTLPFGTYYLPKYAEFVVPTNTFWVGENVNNNRADYLVFTLNNIGPGKLGIVYGANAYGTSTADTTGDGYAESTMGVEYDGAFGPVGVQFQYTTQSRAVDDVQGDGVKKTANDGASLTLMSFAVSYAITEMMGVGLNYESKSTTAGTSGAKPESWTTMELVFNLGLDETMGLSLITGTNTYLATPDTKAKDARVKSETGVSFAKTLGVVKTYAGYYSLSDQTGSADAIGYTSIQLGMTVGF